MCCFPGCFLIIGERDKSVVCAWLLWNACCIPWGRWGGIVFLKRDAGDFSYFTVNCILGVSSVPPLVWVNLSPFLSLKGELWSKAWMMSLISGDWLGTEVLEHFACPPFPYHFKSISAYPLGYFSIRGKIIHTHTYIYMPPMYMHIERKGIGECTGSVVSVTNVFCFNVKGNIFYRSVLIQGIFINCKTLGCNSPVLLQLLSQI